MLFPDSAKTAISEAFYDKEVSVLSQEETTDEEGGKVKRANTVKSTFKGNVRFNALGEVQSELGLVENIDVAISCPTDTEVEVDDIVEYNDTKYLVTDVLPRDSHKLITGSKWRAE